MRLEEGLRIGFRVTVIVEKRKLDAILKSIRENKMEDAFRKLKEMLV